VHFFCRLFLCRLSLALRSVAAQLSTSIVLFAPVRVGEGGVCVYVCGVCVWGGGGVSVSATGGCGCFLFPAALYTHTHTHAHTPIQAITPAQTLKSLCLASFTQSHTLPCRGNERGCRPIQIRLW